MSHEKDGKETLAGVEGENAAVLAYFGLAAYWGQVLENTLVQVLSLAARLTGEVALPTEIATLELANQKKTLGTLLRKLHLSITMPDTIEEVVDQALEQRNFLTHHFFRERDEDLKVPEGRVRMIEELRGIRETICQANEYMILTGKVLHMGIVHDAEHPPASQPT